MDGNEIGEGGLAANPLQQDARGGGAHLMKGWRIVVRLGLWKAALWMSSKPTMETSVGTCKPVVHERANRTDGCDVVVADERGEIAATLDQLVGRLKTEFRRGDAQLKLHDEFRAGPEA